MPTSSLLSQREISTNESSSELSSSSEPQIVVYAKEEDGDVDLTAENPNGMEFDNLYLDMNGLIHPCTHPENEEAPPTEEHMYIKICQYIDRIFAIVRPRKVLYMAIDGVAPRAKMNQQRSRRFTSSREAQEAREDETKLRKELAASGLKLPPQSKEPWDSNVITPGTPFMQRLSERLKTYIRKNQETKPGWNIKVILSDSNVYGEGEHKLMNFIRSQRSQKNYDPNTSHCMYGLDADLIMLALATHEPNFTILREEVLFGKQNQEKSFQTDSVLKTGGAKSSKQLLDQYDLLKAKKKPFQMLKVWILREYLSHEFAEQNFLRPLPFKYDFEKCIDDFVCLCFFVGNDFLPHLPTLSIRDGGLELVLNLYRRFLPTLDGYITSSGRINLKRIEVILKALGTVEDAILKRRRENELSSRNWRKNQEQKASLNQKMMKLGSRDGKQVSKEELKDRLKEMNNKRSVFEVVETEEEKKKFETDKGNKKKTIKDDILLGEDGWRQRYYNKKFEEELKEDPKVVDKVVKEYLFGLCWVMAYYYTGCKSWKWFYPFHYAPFASDMKSLAQFDKEIYGEGEGIPDILPGFGSSKPFKPLEQLLGVLPSKSAHALPKPLQWYMLDSDSPIIDFYPKDFKYDPNGKPVRWLWIALLPFVDEKRIHEVMEEAKGKLTSEEKKRNKLRNEELFLRIDSTDGQALLNTFVQGAKGAQKNQLIKFELLPAGGISGYLKPPKGESFSPDQADEFCTHKVVSFNFTLKKLKNSQNVTGRLLPGVKSFPIELSPEEADQVRRGSGRRQRSYVGNIYEEHLNGGRRIYNGRGRGGYNNQRSYNNNNYQRQNSYQQRNVHPSYQQAYNSLNPRKRPAYNSWGSNEPRQNYKVGRGSSNYQGQGNAYNNYPNNQLRGYNGHSTQGSFGSQRQNSGYRSQHDSQRRNVGSHSFLRNHAGNSRGGNDSQIQSRQGSSWDYERSKPPNKNSSDNVLDHIANKLKQRRK
eukprot:augustus_masked-scaffold_3-processed-gene-6.57-mRNA-1 protein AED:0.05 eAED:0.05 QI:0/0/0/0.5/1/1/2/0/984